jgi:hypothetical protein
LLCKACQGAAFIKAQGCGATAWEDYYLGVSKNSWSVVAAIEGSTTTSSIIAVRAFQGWVALGDDLVGSVAIGKGYVPKGSNSSSSSHACQEFSRYPFSI